MSPRRLLSLRRFSFAVAAVAVVVSIAGCATSSYDTKKQTQKGVLAGHEVADQENDGTYVSAGPLTYQLQISRELNPYSSEDSGYLKGLPAGTKPPSGNGLWYGVFLWAKNQHSRNYRTTDRFVIEDTQGDTYYPLKLDPRVNPYAWTSEQLGPQETEPGQDTTAAMSFTQGKVLVFKLPTTVYDNRPLKLYILSQSSGAKIGSISLDL